MTKKETWKQSKNSCEHHHNQPHDRRHLSIEQVKHCTRTTPTSCKTLHSHNTNMNIICANNTQSPIYTASKDAAKLRWELVKSWPILTTLSLLERNYTSRWDYWHCKIFSSRMLNTSIHYFVKRKKTKLSQIEQERCCQTLTRSSVNLMCVKLKW